NGHTLLNHAIERVDGPAKVSGAAKYTFDVIVPGMLYGRILHSPHACGEIASVDTSAAEKMEGVKAVISYGNKKLNYEGDPVAAVAAVTPEIAEDALRAIKVTYKKLPHVVTPQQAIRPDAPQVYPGNEAVKGNVRPDNTRGDKSAVEEALAKCDAVAEGEY